jgi:uncharacterized protein YuzE
MSIAIAGIDFDRVSYDEDADVLYLRRADPKEAVEFDESPEGHHLRFDRDHRLIGVTIVRPRWLLANHGVVSITLPERVSLDRETLDKALTRAA